MVFTRKVASAAFKASLPVLMGYLAMGIAAGILLAGKAHLGAFWALITSATSISGALQFLLVDMFCNQTALISVALITFCLNFRYALYGLPLIQRWKNLKPALKLYMILTLTDETFALEVENKTPPGEDSVTYCFLIAALDHSYWILGVVLGNIAGSLVEFNSEGIDFAMQGLFMVILTDQLARKENRIPAVIGGLCGLISLTVFRGNMLIPAIVLILILLLSFRKKLEGTSRTENKSSVSEGQDSQACISSSSSTTGRKDTATS